MKAEPPAAAWIPALLRCPGCGDVRPDLSPCARCGWAPALVGTIVDAAGDRPGTRSDVPAFYDRHPFPGYARGEDAPALLDRIAANPLVARIDRIATLDARILDCGCGTGQIAMGLAMRGPGRTVLGADLSWGQLKVAEEFQLRSSIGNVHLVRADLFSLPLAAEAFDVVVCRGVIHHTPDPMLALRAVARHVKPGGMIVVGYYDRFARVAHALRRSVARVVGRPLPLLDPTLRRKDLAPDKKESWIADQYRHPLERSLTLGSVWRELRRSGFDWVGSLPSRAAAGTGDDAGDARAPGRIAMLARELGWMASGFSGEDAGLACVFARRQSRT